MQVGKRNDLPLWAPFSLAGELRRNQLASFRCTLQNGARDRSSDQGRIQQRLGISLLPFGLYHCALRAGNFLGARPDFGKLKTSLQRIRALLIGFELGGRIIESLLRQHALIGQVASAIQNNLVVGQRGPGLRKIVLRLLNFFGTGAVLQLLVIGARVLRCSVGLLILRTELIIFQTDQNLAFFDLVALLHANPLYPACDFGVQVDLVMSHDVPGGRKNDAAKVAVLSGSTSDFDFGSIGGQQSVHQR